MILLRAQGGLCNRLRAINAAYCLSQDTGHRLKVYWNKNVEMNADFHSIFEDPQQYFTVSDVGQENFFLHLFFSPRNFINRIPKVKKGADISEVLNILKKKHNKIWTISAFLEFYRPRTPDYSWLRPKQTILEEINRNLISMGNTSIGLHVRRTDNKMAIKRSPLYLFIDKVEKILSENSQQSFFLATDDNGVKDEMMSRFPEHIYSRCKLARREDPDGLKDAVIDLFLLASCKSLYGSSWSSFSDVAADIGRIPYERLEIKE